MPLRNRTPPMKARALTAAAVQLIQADKAQAIKIRRLRQGWQEDAWSYRDSIPEIGYAMRFKATAVSRMRLFPAAWVEGEDQPVPLDENPTGVPSQLAAAAKSALEELAPGRMGHASLLRNLNENTEVAGECYLLGMDSDLTGEQEWSIKSIDELVVNSEGRYLLRTIPGTGSSDAGGKLLPSDSYISRMWVPHPRFSEIADSPMRSLLESSEELLILSRAIRAAARSRYASAGIMAVADELSFPGTTADGDDDDPKADPFFEDLTESMTTAISDEASAAGVVPIVIRGPMQYIKDGIQFFDPARPFDDKAGALRAELLGRIANGLDIPREILTGVADLNHWTAWQVDDSTFRYHIEPAVLRAIDSLTVGYLRPRLIADGFSRDDVSRLVIWYDPSELVTHPDRTADAIQLYDRFALSEKALRDAAGWNDGDEPDDEEMLARQLTHIRTLPPNIVEAIVHRMFPQLDIPADKNEPSMGPQGELPPDGAVPAIAPEQAPKAIEGPAQSEQPGKSAPPAVAAAAAPAAKVDRSGSARLARIDASLRDTVLAAADQAMHRALERAGNKAKGKAPNAVKASLAGVEADRICAALGQAIVASYGMTEHNLLEEAFAALAERFKAWVDAANRSALTTVVRMLHLPVDAPQVTSARQRQEAATDGAWVWLKSALHARAVELLYHPTEDEQAGRGPLVPVGTVRGSLALAGGYTGQGLTDIGQPVDATRPLGGIGSGPIVGDLLRSAGAEIDHYIWVHGVSKNPFEPHLELDGTEFTKFTDGRLANTADSWVGNQFFFPGDHDGCSCDVQLMWTETGAGENDLGLAASA